MLNVSLIHVKTSCFRFCNNDDNNIILYLKRHSNIDALFMGMYKAAHDKLNE